MQLRNGTWNFRIKPQQKLPESPLYRKKNESPYRNKLCYKYLLSVYGIVTDVIFLWNLIRHA